MMRPSRSPPPARIEPIPDLLIQATIVASGDKTAEGQLVEGVAIPWLEIIRELERNPNFLHEVNWRTFEELIAGAYKRKASCSRLYRMGDLLSRRSLLKFGRALPACESRQEPDHARADEQQRGGFGHRPVESKRGVEGRRRPASDDVGAHARPVGI